MTKKTHLDSLVNVIIPTYNSSRYLKEAVDSVLSQTYRNFEIIIVDDGSIDDTKGLIEEYIKKHTNMIKYVYQTNKGPGVARNNGIVQARGQYVAFLDADDVWLPKKLDTQLKEFAKSESCMLVHSDFDYFDNDGVVKRSEYSNRIKRHFSGDIFYRLFRENFIRTSSVVVKREVLNKVGLFDPEMRMSEDYDLWLRIIKECKNAVCYINETLLKVRYHDERVTKNSEECYMWVNKAIEKAIKYSPDIQDRISAVLPYRFAKNHLSIGYQHFCKGNMLRARKEFSASLKFKPRFLTFVYYLLTFLDYSHIARIKNIKRAVYE